MAAVLFGIAATVQLWRADDPRLTGKPSVVPSSSVLPFPGTFSSQSPPLPQPLVQTWSPQFADELDTLIMQYRAQGVQRVGVVVTDSRTGENVARNADDVFDSASLYKLFVLWRTQVEIRQGKLTDDSELKLTAQNDDADEDGYRIGGYGDTVSVAELRRLMVVASGNTATWVLAYYFGWGTIDQLVQRGGFRQTHVAGHAVTTAGDVTRFLDAVMDGTLDPRLQPDDYTLMLRLLAAQQINTKLSTGFPPDAVFAHKTGDVGNVHHDAGILFLPDDRRIVVTVLAEGDEAATRAFQRDVAATLSARLLA